MAVPKTTMHEDDGAVFWQHDIWLPWQFPDVKAEPEAFAVQQAPHEDFRFCVPSPDAGHHPASGCGIHHVCHGIQPNTKGDWVTPARSCSIMVSMCGTMIRATSRMSGTTTLFPNWR